MTSTVYAKNSGNQDGTGLDQVFQVTGISKPVEWNNWNERVKHSWLQEQGIYPEVGRKYGGEFDEQKYWDFLSEEYGVQKPEDWLDMSFGERQEYLEINRYKEEKGLENEVVEMTENEMVDIHPETNNIETIKIGDDKDEIFFGEWMAMLAYVLGIPLLIGLVTIWSTWKSKNSQRK